MKGEFEYRTPINELRMLKLKGVFKSKIDIR